MAPTPRTDVAVVTSQSEVRRLLDLDTVPWYKRRNLRRLYFALIPAVLGVEMTSGYDGSIMNGLQAVKPWLDCRFIPLKTYRYQTDTMDSRLRQPEWCTSWPH